MPRLHAGTAWLALSGVFLFLPQFVVAQVDEITVTARKEAENLQEIPLAITAFESEVLLRRGINNIDDLAQNTAGLVFDYGITNQDTRVVIRGLSPTRGRQNIAFLQDNIDISSEAISTAGGSLLVNPRYLDFERIEVVKGPQSALYGRAAFNGAINYITKDPGDKFEFEIIGDANTAAGSENDEYQVNVSAGGPVTDTFGVRGSAAYWNEDGYYNNPFTADENLGGGDGFGFSVKGVWQPTDKFSAKARVSYSDDNYEQRPAAFLPYNTLTFFPREAITHLWVMQEFNGGDPTDFTNYSYDVCGDRYEAGGANTGVLNTVTSASPCAMEIPVQPDGSFRTRDVSDPRVKSALFTAPVASFTGKVPDSDDLSIRLSPNPATIDPAGISKPQDYPGTQIDVLRFSLELNWDLDNGTITSWTGLTSAEQDVLIDFDKFAANPGDIEAALFQSPTGPGPDRVLGTADDIFCSWSGGDCAWGTQQVEFTTETDQFSQEIRFASSVGDKFNYTVGGMFWREETVQVERSATARASDGIFPFTAAAFRDAMGGTRPNCYSPFAGPAAGVAMQSFLPDWDDLLSPGEGAFLGAALQGPDDVSVPAGHNLLCPASSSDILQYLDERAFIRPRNKQANTDHWSVYGTFDFDFAEVFRFSFEGRYTNEREEQENPVFDPVINPALGPRDSPSSIQPNCGMDPASPMPDGNICADPIPPGVGVNGIWSTPFFPTKFFSTRTAYFTPRAAIEWRPIVDQLYYVSYAVGKKPGGFSRLTSGSGGFNAEEARFDEEKLEVYEVGAKTTLFDNTVRFNVAGYFQDFTDKQVPTTLINSQTGLSTPAVENAAAAEIWGLEVEMTWAPTERIDLGLAYNYLDSEYVDFVINSNSSNDLTRASSEVFVSSDPIIGTGAYRIGNSCANPSARSTIDAFGDPTVDLRCQIDLSGNELEDVPKHSLNLNAGYTAPFLIDSWEWYVQGEYVYQDSRFLEQWNDNSLSSYDIVNARLGLLNDNWEAVFYVENLFEDKTVRTAQTGPGISTGNFIDGPPRVRNQVIAYPAPPRVFGVRLKYRFGG